jgi:phospholipid/cholesterol/gamma-HCH transport system substrate-binding protein
METRARYILIGLFTVGVVFLGFAFVYWMQNAGGLGTRARYRVQFAGPVSGLTGGSRVLFNGVRVGEVTGLRLDRENPSRLEADIAIDPAAPVRADTRVTIEFLGLTGSPVILLKGGSASAPALTSKDGEPPLLAAGPEAGVSMMQAGRRTLQRLDAILSENSEALHGALSNLNAFSGALSRNSEKVDGIFAGLERLTGGGKKGTALVYELSALKKAPPGAKAPAGLLTVPEPTALMALDSDKIQARPGIGGKPALEGIQFADNLPRVVQDKVLQSFENAGFGQLVARPVEGVTSDYQLMIAIRAFQINTGSEPSAEVEFTARVMASDGKIAAVRTFRKTVPVRSVDAPVAAAALDEAFGKALSELTPWALEAAGKPVEPANPSVEDKG